MTNPTSITTLSQIVISTEFTIWERGDASSESPPMPRAMTSVGIKIPIPYTPSPSHAQGTPVNITCLIFLLKNVLNESSGASVLVVLVSGTSIVTLLPRKYFTDFSASLTLPFDISHPGLWAKCMRVANVRPPRPVIMNKSSGQLVAVCQVRTIKKQRTATKIFPTEDEAFATPTINIFHLSGIISEI